MPRTIYVSIVVVVNIISGRILRDYTFLVILFCICPISCLTGMFDAFSNHQTTH